MATNSTAVIYCRISKDRTGAGLGVERQEQDCRELADRLGLTVADVFSDNDVSAYQRKRRPGYEQLKAGLKGGRWDTLLIWHVDRLYRSLRDLEDVVDLVNGRVAVHTVKGGEIDLETAEGRLQARMLGSVARYESEHRSDRTKRALAQNADNGHTHGGRKPYGWNMDGTIQIDEAEIVRELTRRVIAFESCRSLAADLNRRGVISARGGRWSPKAVRELVIRPRNAGLRQRDDDTFTKVTDREPLVDRDTWDTVRAVILDPARRTNTGNHVVRLMSGLMSCGTCGDHIRAGGSKQDMPIYRCAAGHVTRRVQFVDQVVESYVLALLEREGVRAPTTISTGSAAKADSKPNASTPPATTLRLRLEQVEDKYLAGDVSRAAYLRNRDRLAARLADLERKEALSRVPSPMEGVTPERWAALPLDRKRAVISYLVDVRLLPSGRRRNDPELVAITKRRRD
jgi:DNA invertase Pin-like site-specific DNA recombinase